MTVAAPQRPPRSNDPVDDEEFEALVEALIEEARQRARRRRRMYGAVAAVVALVGVTVFAGFERTAQSQSAPPAFAAQSSLASGTAGSKIAFVRTARGQQGSELYVMNADGSGQRRLTRGARYLWAPAWSPDGRKIAFASGGGGNFHVYVMNADGSGKVVLDGPGPGSASPDAHAWSPDGRKIVVGSQTWLNGTSAIWVVNADGSGGDRWLAQNTSLNGVPGWSPDGRTIAFTSRGRSGWEVYVGNAEGSRQWNRTPKGQRNLTRKPGDDYFAAWSPDGRKIAFTSDRDGNLEVYLMNADGSGQRRLTRNARDDVTPAWSPDGRKLAFASRGRDGWDVYAVNADGEGLRRLTQSARNDLTPAWSVDGRSIGFTSDRDGQFDIYVMNADGSEQRNLTRTPGADEGGFSGWAGNANGFAWSPALRPKG